MRAPHSAAALVAVLLLTGCTADAGPTPSPTPSPTVVAAGDGVLRIGTAFPTSAAGAVAQVAAVEVAVREINEAGGVLGAPVEVVHRAPGDTADAVPAMLDDLVSKPIDVLIGLATAAQITAALPAATESGVAVISPLIRDPALSTLADDGLVFRTVPSTTLAATALAEHLAQQGVSRIAVALVAEPSGEPSNAAIVAAIAAGLDGTGIEVVFDDPMDAAAPDLGSLLSTDPDAVVLALPDGAPEPTSAVLARLADAAVPAETLWMAQGAASALPAGAASLASGAEVDAAFAARLKASDPAVGDLAGAAEAYDAAVLAALAATVAGNDAGRAVAQRLLATSGGGIPCASYGECLAVLETEADIDYRGVSGPIDLDAAGDPAAAVFGLLRLGADGAVVREQDLVVGSETG